MCQYGMTAYKPHLTCFRCRKTFRRRLLFDIKKKPVTQISAKCPECGGLLADMGLDFKSPPKNVRKAWKHVTEFYSIGVFFHSCGCAGSGYIPRDSKALLAHLETIKLAYIVHLRAWIQYTEPQTKKEKALSKQKRNYLSPPHHLTLNGKKKVSKEEVIHYWTEKN